MSPSYWFDVIVTFVLRVILAVLLRILYFIKGENVKVNKEVTLEKSNSIKPAAVKTPKKQQKTRAISEAKDESKTVNLVTGTPSELRPEENNGTAVPSEPSTEALLKDEPSKEEDVKTIPLDTKPQEKEDKHNHNLEIDCPPFEMKTTHGIAKESNMVPIEFHWKHGGNKVFVTGDFDDWKAEKHEMHLNPGTNDFVAVVEIDRTKQHEFKFVVDGNWQCNWDFPTRDDGCGNVNNILYPNPVGPLSPEYKDYVIDPFSSQMTATAY
ncbi:2704_t:CDS:2 [Acaulospora morrowiae]|uniref:2704_t:CDS:1 n=1 Tax=Acaulospora morrowiae TaxID=94023 RepID=A0A9N9E2L1_9GLOM|nr:2704_t:CDS:2 [Acaulospora morrowiae]